MTHRFDHRLGWPPALLALPPEPVPTTGLGRTQLRRPPDLRLVDPAGKTISTYASAPLAGAAAAQLRADDKAINDRLTEELMKQLGIRVKAKSGPEDEGEEDEDGNPGEQADKPRAVGSVARARHDPDRGQYVDALGRLWLTAPPNEPGWYVANAVLTIQTAARRIAPHSTIFKFLRYCDGQHWSRAMPVCAGLRRRDGVVVSDYRHRSPYGGTIAWTRRATDTEINGVEE